MNIRYRPIGGASLPVLLPMAQYLRRYHHSCLPQHDCSDCRADYPSCLHCKLQILAISLVGYRNPVSRARDSTKILRLRLIHHRQKIPICQTAGGGGMHPPILPLDPPLHTAV